MRIKAFIFLALLLIVGSCIKRPEEEAILPQGGNPVVAECFTNIGCVHCPEAESIMASYLQEDTNLLVINYHVGIPLGNDPFYLADSAEINRILNFYFPEGLQGTPGIVFNGTVRYEGVSAAPIWPGIIDSLHDLERAVTMTGEGEYSPDTRSGWIKVYVSGDIESGLYLKGLLLESGIEYQAPNGDTLYDHLVRDIIPDPSGIPVDSEGSYRLDFSLSEDIEAENSEIVVIIQDASTKFIEWAIRFPISELPEPQPGYSFEFHVSDTILNVPVNLLTTTRLYLENTGTLNDIYLIEVIRDSLAEPQWSVSLCREVCLPYLTAYDTIPAGERDTSYTIDFIHWNETDPPGFVIVRVTSQGDTSLVDSSKIWVYPQ